MSVDALQQRVMARVRRARRGDGRCRGHPVPRDPRRAPPTTVAPHGRDLMHVCATDRPTPTITMQPEAIR